VAVTRNANLKLAQTGLGRLPAERLGFPAHCVPPGTFRWRRFLRPPTIIVIKKPFNKFIIVYAVVAFVLVVVVVACVLRYRQRQARVRLHEVRFDCLHAAQRIAICLSGT
jgi:hypothetical protein